MLIGLGLFQVLHWLLAWVAGSTWAELAFATPGPGRLLIVSAFAVVPALAAGNVIGAAIGFLAVWVVLSRYRAPHP